MKRYEAYKDSGIEWIGQIPQGWAIMPLKYCLSLKGRIGWNGLKSDEFEEESYAYLVTGQDFQSDVVDWSKCYQINKERYDEDPFIQLENGDLLVTKDGTIGKVAKVSNLDKPACLNSGIFVVKQTKGLFVQDYLYWLLVSNQLKEFVGFNSTGATIAHLYQNVFENMPLIVPSIKEQHFIASYLNIKVGQIDLAISAINTQIDELKSYRQSIISEVVTKGLNPDVPMKDSGVDWIGQIPREWDILKLKRVAMIQTGGTPSTNNDRYWENATFDWYTPGDFSDDTLYLFDSVRKISHIAIEENAAKLFPPQTVLMVGIGATLGKVAFVNDECSANQQINALLFNDIMNPKYGAYFLSSKKNYVRSLSNSATLPIINQTTTGDILICIPPYSEQSNLAAYLDRKMEEIDSSIKKLITQRDDLNALKQSVISEAVTGQIDVRNWNNN